MNYESTKMCSMVACIELSIHHLHNTEIANSKKRNNFLIALTGKLAK